MSDEHDILEDTSRNEATTLTTPATPTVASNPQETSKKVGYISYIRLLINTFRRNFEKIANILHKTFDKYNTKKFGENHQTSKNDYFVSF